MRCSFVSFVTFAAATVSATGLFAAGSGYTIEALRITEAASFEPVGISDNGSVAGFAFYSPDMGTNGPNVQAAIWYGEDNSQRLIVGRPFSQAMAINSTGLVVGYAGGLSESDPEDAFVFGNALGALILPSLAGGPTFAQAVSDDGEVIGTTEVNGRKHAVRWSTLGEVTDLGPMPDGDAAPTAVNTRGDIVGFASTVDQDDNLVYTPHMWRAKTDTLEPLSGLTGIPHDIADDGTVVGTTSENQAFVYKDGSSAFLPTADDLTGAQAHAIAPDGTIVGAVGDGFADSRAAIWVNGELAELNDLIPHDSGWWLHTAIGINANGQIIGMGYLADERLAYLITPTSDSVPAVPLPSAIGLVASAAPFVIGAIVARRRRELQ